MSDDEKPKPEPEKTTDEQAALQQQPARAAIDELAPLVRLAEKYFADAEREREFRIQELLARSKYEEKELERDSQQDARNHELAIKEADLKKHVFNRVSLIGAFVLLLVFTTATILILRGDTDAGIKVLAYVAVGASLVTGGIGFERARQEKKRREELEAFDDDSEDD